MTSPSDTDRARILQRRAAFLSSALTALGCSAQPPAPNPEPVVAVPVRPPVDTDPGANAEPPPPPPPPPPTVSTDKPSLAIPDDVGEVAKRNFEHFAKSMTQLYELLDKMEAAVPKDCTILKPACDEHWQRVAAIGLQMRRVQMFMHRCPGTSADAKRFAAFAEEHRKYRGRRQATVDARISAAIAGGGEAARKRWDQHKQEAYQAKPFPCLSMGCADW